MSEMDEVVGEFLVESYENLDQLDADLLMLERDPSARDTLARIFRTVHTIKGTCGFLGFSTLERVSHAGENLLSLLRDGELAVDHEIADALLALTDALRGMLRRIETEGDEGADTHEELIATLVRLQQRADDAADAAEPSDSAADAAAPSVEAAAEGVPETLVDAVAGAPEVPAGDPPPADAPPPPPPLGQMLIEKGLVKPDDVTFAVHEQQLGDPRRLGEILVDQGAVDQKDLDEALASQKGASLAESTVRVDVGVLDSLMTLVGELVLARNQVLQFTSESDDAALIATSQRLNLITSELQESVMKTRLQAVGSVWNRFPRIVRDLAHGVGKQARIEMEGEDTELDRTIIEAIKDPLTHLVRNAVDHGIETPERRVAVGKPAEGRILLRAYHEGGHVNIEMADDGAGMDPDRIRAKAVEKGLLSVDAAARLSDREAINLIFAPGFSTAEQVTNVSGRGVGMDVVKTNIEQIGGSIDVAAELGRGTTITIKIPLTLAIIPALTVTCRGERYAIPQVSLLELVRLQGDQAARGIELVHGAPVHRLRGRLLPLVYLDEQLHGAREAADDVVNIVVLQAGGCRFGLVVDRVNDTQEIVVKPLGAQLKSVATYAGATIMGDGRVALILDVLGLAERAGLLAAGREPTADLVEGMSSESLADRERLLLVGVGDDRRCAIPLDEVARLEEFPADRVERAGHDEVVQYRGRILPLVRLSAALGVPGGIDGEDLSVVVVGDGEQAVGVVVDSVLDIVEERLTVESHQDRHGMRGSAVIAGRVTDVVDLVGLLGLTPSTAALSAAPTGA